MKRFLLELFVFILGFALGFGELLYLYFKGEEASLYFYIPRFFYGIINRIDNEFLRLIPWWAYVLVCIIVLLILGVVITEFLRLFSNTKSIKGLTVILYIVITIVVAIPITRFIMLFTDLFISRLDFIVYSIIRGIYFSIILRFQIYVFGFSYKVMLKKQVRNCRVLLCEATGNDSYDIKGVLAKRVTFNQGYNFLKNYTEEIEKGQFFRIIEKGLFGIGIIDHWNYYRGGQAMDCTEEEFLEKLYSSSVFKGLRLKSEEDKNE